MYQEHFRLIAYLKSFRNSFLYLSEDIIRMWNLSEKEIERLTKVINNFKNITERLVEFNVKIAFRGMDLIKEVEFKDKN